MKNIDWANIRLIAILCVTVFLYAFTGKRNEQRNLEKAEIFFADNDKFITKDAVNKLLIQNFGPVNTIKKVQLDLNKVEKTISANPMVGRAKVYATVDGKLIAEITQKQPVARAFQGTKSYYIDYGGKAMPLSESETARVPLLTGDFNKLDRKKLKELLNYIYDDDFLRKNITGISVMSTGYITMNTRGYSYDILFGGPVNIDRKFKNYKAFLQDATKDTLIENYKTINLKFTEQVVCTKK